MIVTSAPGKLMLFGEHAVVHGRPCVVTAVDQRMYVEVQENGVGEFYLRAPDLGLKEYMKPIDNLGGEQLPKAVRFAETVYKRFLEKYPQEKGIVVTTKSDFSSSFGFGSSSAVSVALAKGLVALYGVEMSNQELFELCYGAVLEVQGVGSGFDVAAAIWGGTIYYVSPGKVIEPMKIDELPLVVGYTGVKADTPTLVRMVNELKEEEQEMVNGVFDEIGKIVVESRVAIGAQDWEQVGKLMKRNQMLLRKLHVSSVELDALIGASEGAGALGAKLSGAGGGDCMLALRRARDKQLVKEIEQAIEEVGGEVMKVGLQAEGVRVEPKS